MRFNHLTLQEERSRVWDDNYTQLHYSQHNNRIQTSSLVSEDPAVDLPVICNVNVAGVVLSTSLCQQGGGKVPCANTDNAELFINSCHNTGITPLRTQDTLHSRFPD